MAIEEKSPELNPALKEKYEMKNGVQPGPAHVKVNHGHRDVDFRTMTPEQADELIAAGCMDIAKKDNKQKPTA